MLVVGVRSGILIRVRTRDVNVQNSEKPLTFARTWAITDEAFRSAATVGAEVLVWFVH